jgi:hypothetical protein
MPFYSIYDEELDEYRKRVEAEITETAWAKIVKTANGYGILLNGSVIELVSSNPNFHTEVITRALRRQGGEQSEGCTSDGPSSEDTPRFATQEDKFGGSALWITDNGEKIAHLLWGAKEIVELLNSQYK